VGGGTAVHLAAGGDIRVLKRHAAERRSFGGGLAAVASRATRLVFFKGNVFQENVACWGGGVWVHLRAAQRGARCVLAGAKGFDGCQARWGVGGALYVSAASTAGVAVDVAGAATFLGNLGGALFVEMEETVGGRVDVHGDASFVNNAALDDNGGRSTYGGALNIIFTRSKRGTANIAGGNSSFNRNTAGLSGGAAYLDFQESSAGAVTIQGNASFELCTALGGGAVGLAFWGSTNGAVTTTGNASFERNTADSGGAVSLEFGGSKHGAATIMGNSGFLRNTASSGGAAVRGFPAI
jgi:hypothetical protein